MLKGLVTAALICLCLFATSQANAPALYDSQARLRAAFPGLPADLFDNTPLEPAKVFDNLYCVGTRSVVAWVITTSDGIILLDAMWDSRDAEIICDSIKKLGLDPAQLKYIVLTHGHIDHYGGAQALKEKLGAKIFMSSTDRDIIANDPQASPCTVDELLEDGQRLTLGATTLTVVATPGHSPGCMSFIFSVTDNGLPYTVAYWGGGGAPAALADKKQYRQSIDHFAGFTAAAGVQVAIFGHPFADNGYWRLETVRNRQAGEPNPFVLGRAAYLQSEDGRRQYIDNLIRNQESQ